MIWRVPVFNFNSVLNPKGTERLWFIAFGIQARIYLITSVKLGEISVVDGDSGGGVGDREGGIQIILERLDHVLQRFNAGCDRLLTGL